MTTRQEGAKEIGCLQAETKHQEASILQRSLQPFRCTGTQFRKCSLQRHRSLFSNGFPRTSILQTPRLFDENDKEIQGLLEEKHRKHKAYFRNTRSVSSKTAYSNICKTVQTRLKRHARLLPEQKGWWNPVLCRQKGYEDLWCTQDNIWSPELRNHLTP